MTPSKVPEPLFVLANFLTNRLEVSTMISKGFQPQLFLVKALPLPGSVGETGDLLITHYWAVFWSLTSESALIFTQAASQSGVLFSAFTLVEGESIEQGSAVLCSRENLNITDVSSNTRECYDSRQISQPL